MNDSKTSIDDLKKRVYTFIDERDWHQFHSPKNMSMAISIEAAELMELFMWDTTEQSINTLEKKRAVIEQEVADIFANLLSLCAHYHIDLTQALENKMKLNELKYPISKSKGIATKYNEL